MGIRKYFKVLRTMMSSMRRVCRNTYNNMNTNNIHILTCFIGGISCLLPLYIYPVSMIEDSLLRTAELSNKNRETAVAALTLLGPLLLDLLTELSNSLFKNSNTAKEMCQPYDGLLNSAERCVFFLGTLLIPATAFFPSTTHNWAYIYLCCQKAQLTLVGGAVTVSLCRYDQKFWTIRLTNMCLFLTIFGTVASAFVDNYDPAMVSKVDVRSLISDISYYCILVAVIIFLYCSMTWLRVVVPMFVRWYRSTASIQQPQDSKKLSRLVFPAMYVVTSIMSISLLVTISALYSGIAFYDVDALLLHNMAFIVYLLFISYLSMRMMKYEMVQGLVRQTSFCCHLIRSLRPFVSQLISVI